MAKADAPPMFMDSKDLELVRKMYPVSDAVAKRSLGPTEWSKLPVGGGKFPQIGVDPATPGGDKTVTRVVTHKRLRQSSKPLMNKLEGLWWALLQIDYPGVEMRAQSIRFKLANGLWYKPDVFSFEKMTAWEVKGPKSWRGGFENLKVAAATYPDITWILVWRDKTTALWHQQQVLP